MTIEKLVAKLSPICQISSRFLLHQIRSQDIALITNIATSIIFILPLFLLTKCEMMNTSFMICLILIWRRKKLKKLVKRSKVLEFSIWVAAFCKALAKFYEHRTATPISSAPSLKCAVEVFICNKYFGDKFFTRNKYFGDKPQIPWEHWHWYFLSGNLTKLLFVTPPMIPIE